MLKCANIASIGDAIDILGSHLGDNQALIQVINYIQNW